MKARVGASLTGLLLVGNCACGGAREDPTPARASCEWNVELGEETPTVQASTLQDVVDADGRVAIVRVLSGKIEDPGTRGEKAIHEAETVVAIYGELGPSPEVWYFTHDREIRLITGCYYALALTQHASFRPRWLVIGFQEVADGAIEEESEELRRRLADIKTRGES